MHSVWLKLVVMLAATGLTTGAQLEADKASKNLGIVLSAEMLYYNSWN